MFIYFKFISNLSKDMPNLKTHLINEEIPNITLSYDEKVELYKYMLEINTMEKHLEKEYANKKIRGFCHLSIGQECLYAVLKKLIKDDLLISSYRCHAAGYAAGIEIKEIICENIGTRQGNCRGKGGSMHLYNHKFFGGHGIVGSQVPLGAGLAFALKYKSYQKEKQLNNEETGRDNFINCKTKDVVFVIYGDGASNQGQIYETFNMAKIYNLPIVFIVENNKYGMYTPVESVSVDDCFYKRGYLIPWIRVSDINIDDLYSSIIYSRKYAISQGPIIIQVDTHRICGHSTLDNDQSYRNNDDLNDDDSLKTLEKILMRHDVDKVKEMIADNFNRMLSEIDSKDTLSEQDLFTDLFYYPDKSTNE